LRCSPSPTLFFWENQVPSFWDRLTFRSGKIQAPVQFFFQMTKIELAKSTLLIGENVVNL
jgi:hypothetical protein